MMKLPNSEFNPKIIFIVGMPFSGKSFLAQEISKETGFDLIDTDDEIEKLTNKKIAEIFQFEGEPFFRELEMNFIRKMFLQKPAIIATGGGLPCFHQNIEWMNEHGKTLFLNTPMEILIQRAYENTNRPLLQSKNKEEIKVELEKLMKERIKFYQKAQFQLNFGEDWQNLGL